jgi:hypothetical protein
LDAGGGDDLQYVEAVSRRDFKLIAHSKKSSRFFLENSSLAGSLQRIGLIRKNSICSGLKLPAFFSENNLFNRSALPM